MRHRGLPSSILDLRFSISSTSQHSDTPFVPALSYQVAAVASLNRRIASICAVGDIQSRFHRVELKCVAPSVCQACDVFEPSLRRSLARNADSSFDADLGSDRGPLHGRSYGFSRAQRGNYRPAPCSGNQPSPSLARRRSARSSSAAEPNRNGSLHRQRVNPCVGDCVPRPLKVTSS